MKKSLIALAALAAVSAASAQSSVTLYGVVDIGYGSHATKTRDGTGSIKTSGVMDGANAGNRIGFRGTEDLGGGLKANFVVEQGISPTNGQLFSVRAGATGHQVDGFGTAGSATGLSGSAGSFSTSTNRQSYVGLSSDKVGTVNIGYQYTILYELATLSGYAVGSEGVPGADKAHLHGQGGLTNSARGNAISYISPNFSGFTVRAQYGAGTGRESVETNNGYLLTPTAATTGLTNGYTTDKIRRMALMLQYANGPLSAAAAYTNLRFTQANQTTLGAQQAQGATLSVFNVAGAPGTTALTGATRTGNLFQLGGSYDFGVAKLAGTYNTGKNGGNATAPGANLSYRAYQVGVAVPFGAIVPFAAYGRARTDSDVAGGTGATLAAAATNRVEDYKTMQVGVRYSLSKRTTAYAVYGRTINDAAALAGATSFYRDTKALVGVAHSF